MLSNSAFFMLTHIFRRLFHRRRRDGTLHLQMRDPRRADEPLRQILVLLRLHQETHVHDERRHVPQHETNNVIGNRAAPDVNVNLEIIRRLMIRNLESFTNNQRFSSHGALHHPRTQSDVRNEFEARVSEVVVSIDETSK